MRREIDTVPKDGKSVILEDDARGTYALAHWSTEQSAWVGEDGKPISITPTHWLPRQRDESLLQREAESRDAPDPQIRHIPPLSSGQATLEWPPAQEDAFAPRRDARAAVAFPVIEPRTAASKPGPPAGRRLVVSLVAAAMIATSLSGMYFRAPIAAYLTQYAAQHDIARIGQADLLGRAPAVQARGKSEGSGEQTVPWGAVQTTGVSQATETWEKERLDAAATAPQSQGPNEATELKKAADTATSELQRERERAEALASELAKVRREVDALAALSGKKSDETARPNQAAESATAKPSAAEAKQCSAAEPSNPQKHWSYRMIDGRKCWYQGENNFPKSLLRWSEQDFSPHGFGKAEPSPAQELLPP